MLLLLIIRQLFVTPLAIYPIVQSGQDDTLMVTLGKNLFEGKYLGAYTQNTFVKGIGFPLYLAICKSLNASYINLSLLYYGLSCMIFVLALRSMLSKGKLAVLYTVLLFNPSALCLLNLQRVYRNNIVLSQVLIIFGCVIALYLYRNESVRRKLVWSVLGGIHLWWIMNTREESFWIMPFVIVATLVTLVLLFIENKENKHFRNISTLVTILPLVMLFVLSQLQSTLNYHYYGEYLVNEISGGEFPNAMRAIYSVKPVEHEDKYGNRVSVPLSTLNKLYEISPTLNSMQDTLNTNYALFNEFDSHPEDGQLENGWFFWVVRETVYIASDGTAVDCQRLYKQISDEINTAISDGRLEIRATMPSALMAPWRNSYLAEYPPIILRTIKSVVCFDEVGSDFGEAEVGDGDPEVLKLYSYMTGDDIIYEDMSTNADRADLQTSVDNINLLYKLYSTVNPVLFVIGGICFVILLVRCFIMRKFSETANAVLFISAIGLSLLLLVCGVAYNQLVSCYSVHPLYLAFAYEMLLACVVMSILFTVKLPRLGGKESK